MLNPQGVLLPVEIPELAELQQRVASCKQLAAGARHLLQVAPTQRSTIAQLKVLQVRGRDPDRSSRVGVFRDHRPAPAPDLNHAQPMIRTEKPPPQRQKGLTRFPGLKPCTGISSDGHRQVAFVITWRSSSA